MAKRVLGQAKGKGRKWLLLEEPLKRLRRMLPNHKLRRLAVLAYDRVQHQPACDRVKHQINRESNFQERTLHFPSSMSVDLMLD